MRYQDEPKGSGAGQGFGVAGFVLGLIGLILSFIPCLGMYALLPGVIALLFSAIAFSQANRANAPKGLIIAAIVISLTGTLIASWQLIMIRRATTGFERVNTEFPETVQDEIKENIRQALEDTEIHRDTDGDDTLVTDSDEMIEELERLEEEKTREEEKTQEKENNINEEEGEDLGSQ
ncbi:MAG: hypothetical protein ACLFQA_01795 [Bacteroidales bacterium]